MRSPSVLWNEATLRDEVEMKQPRNLNKDKKAAGLDRQSDSNLFQKFPSRPTHELQNESSLGLL